MKTKVSDETCFRKDKDKTSNAIPNETAKHNCTVLLQIQSVYYNNNEDENYYPQVFYRAVDILLLLIINKFMRFLILQILSQRVNLKKSLIRILNKDMKTIF